MMTLTSDSLEASYAFCRSLSRRSGSNFYLGFLLLPREKRRAMDALYAYMRHTDDLADSEPTHPEGNIGKSTELKREEIRCWRASLENALAGKEISDADETAKMLLPALADTVGKFGIPGEYLYAVLDGVEMDLDRQSYETSDELESYCQRVASAVGLACIHIWGFRGRGTPEAEIVLEYARQAGIALQLTNILRDLKADACSGRVYLPLEDLRKCGYSVEKLEKGEINEAYHRLMAMEIERAKNCYREGLKLMDYLHRDGRRIFGLMMSVYMNILINIRRRPGDVFVRHIRLGKIQRLLLAVGWAFFPTYSFQRCSHIINMKNNERTK